MLVLGHRGGRGPDWPPENTLEAFQRALDEGADGVELDVRLCASGEPVVAHDRTLARITSGSDRRPVLAVRRADLPRLVPGARIPLLDEALDLCHGRTVNVEVKADAPERAALVRAVARALARARAADVVLSSFDPLFVLAFVAVARGVPRGVLVGPRTPRLATALPLAMRRVVSAAHLEDGLATEARLDRLRAAGLRRVVWTVNDGARAATLRGLGIEGLITDRPAEILAAIDGHGAHGTGASRSI